ncbi:MAG: NHLP family bacteriocin export ABC transporter peptidase/permease/ATPase subunit [Butyrivibrio sp.]|nr:NHLP family bacteriocin export ABC transporter peptidase/permease/ATPase subunit [Butyrivibrio sp.]
MKGKIKKPKTKGVARTPMIMQMESLECGAAALCMVLAYYGKWVPLEKARIDCGVSRDGSNARKMLDAARNYGMVANAYKFEPEELIEEGQFPCIVHWEFNHFVVCKGFSKDKVFLNDPARGSIIVSKERFDEAFTGVVLMMEPGENFETGGKRKSMFGYIRKHLEGSSVAVSFVTLTTIIASLTAIFRAGYSRIFLDRLIVGLNRGWIRPFFIGLVLLAIIEITSSWIKAIYSLRINGKMAVVGSSSYMWKILRLPMEFFSQRMAGDLQLRKMSNTQISQTLIDTVAPLFFNSLMMIFYLVVMFRYSITLTCFGIFFVIVNAFICNWISLKRINIMRVMLRDEGKLASSTVNAIDMIETIKSSGAENGFFEKWSGFQASVNTQSIKYQKQDAYLGMIPAILSGFVNATILGIGVYFVLEGRFTVGMAFAFQGFMNSFLGPAGNLVGAGQTIQEMRTAMERIEDVLSYPDDPMFDNVSDEEHYEKLSGNISMRGVTFGYSRLDAPLIKDFELEVKKGQKIALVGASGSGKSTLSKLISGLYRPWEGEILFDGKPIEEIDRNVFTGSVAVVDQDIILFEDSVADNIKMWDSSIEDFEVILAARDAGIHDNIMKRPGDYSYGITQRGTNFSGGERQRIEIARVLAQDPTIVILDEATSALDARTEKNVVQAIADRGITTIVIAHRLSTIRDCDEIIVLDHGRVIERGKHDELIRLGGTYNALVSIE